jgi:hypothetical protein
MSSEQVHTEGGMRASANAFGRRNAARCSEETVKEVAP